MIQKLICTLACITSISNLCAMEKERELTRKESKEAIMDAIKQVAGENNHPKIAQPRKELKQKQSLNTALSENQAELEKNAAEFLSQIATRVNEGWQR